MNVSVIISNFNGLKYLPRLFESLEAQTRLPAEIIVVDRESRDGSLDFLSARNNVKIITETPSSGLGAGYAAGAKAANGSLLFFSNEDMWFDSGCLAALVSQIIAEKRIAVADAWQWTYDGARWIHGGVRFSRCRWDLNSPYPKRSPEFVRTLPSGAPIPFPCAGAFLITRQAYEEVGGWDTAFFLDHEDIDLGIRLWQRGWKCVTCADAKVYHAVGASNVLQLQGETVSARRYRSAYTNSLLIALKYFGARGLLLGFANYSARVLNNLRRLRFSRLPTDARVLYEALRLLPTLSAHRRKNTAVRSGEVFFEAEEFQAGA